MGGLHRFPYHPNQIVAQGVKIGLVPQLGREGFEGLSRVVLPTVEAPVDEVLGAAPQRVEQGCYHKGRSHNGELRKVPLAGERVKDGLGRRDAPEDSPTKEISDVCLQL